MSSAFPSKSFTSLPGSVLGAGAEVSCPGGGGYSVPGRELTFLSEGVVGALPVLT